MTEEEQVKVYITKTMVMFLQIVLNCLGVSQGKAVSIQTPGQFRQHLDDNQWKTIQAATFDLNVL